MAANTLTLAAGRLQPAVRPDGRLKGGNRYVLPWIGGIGVTPYAAGQFTTFDLPAYTESVVSGANTLALAYAAKTVTATRIELGLRTDKSWAMPDAILTLLRPRRPR